MSDAQYPGSISRLELLRDLPAMELSRMELGPQAARAIPMTMSEDGIRVLVGLRFETAAEAEDCANGLAAFCDRDGERLVLKQAAAINSDFSGVH